MDIIIIFKKIYQIITFRYLMIFKMNKHISKDNIYNDIIKEELDFYNFYKITGVYMRSPVERKKYLNAYSKHKEKIDLLFKEFVLMKEYLIIDSDYNISVNLKKSKLHYIARIILFGSIIVFLSGILFLYMTNNKFIFLTLSIIATMSLLVGIYFQEPYENAKKTSDSKRYNKS